MEEIEEAYYTPLKIGNLFFNRCAADEDAAFESVGVYNLQKSSHEMAYQYGEEYKNFENERKEKGMDINHNLPFFTDILDKIHKKKDLIRNNSVQGSKKLLSTKLMI